MRSWELGRSGAMFPCPMAWRRPFPSRCFFDVLRPVEKPVDPWTSPAARRPPQITKAPVFSQEPEQCTRRTTDGTDPYRYST